MRGTDDRERWDSPGSEFHCAIWKMLAALTVDIVTFMTVWSMSTILQYSILNLNKNNFKLQQKLSLVKFHPLISLFIKKLPNNDFKQLFFLSYKTS